MMEKSEFLDLCGAYALGALDEVDAARFRAAIPHADAEMRAALADAGRVAEQLSLAAPEAEPSLAVKARLMQRIHAEPRRAPLRVPSPAPVSFPIPDAPRSSARARRPSALGRLFEAWLTPRPGLAVAFSLIVLSAGLLAYSIKLRETVADQRAGIGARDGLIAQLADSLVDADSVRATLVALQDSLAREQALLALLRCPAMREIALAAPAPPAAADSSATVAQVAAATSPPGGTLMWDPDHGFAVLQVALPREPEDKDYQLWMIRDGKPVSAGVFHVASDPGSRAALYRLDALSPTEAKGRDAFAVTLEPKGGMPKPTGATVLSGGLEI